MSSHEDVLEVDVLNNTVVVFVLIDVLDVVDIVVDVVWDVVDVKDVVSSEKVVVRLVEFIAAVVVLTSVSHHGSL
jgi:hypothetical protein